jgi:hypothetical protein
MRHDERIPTRHHTSTSKAKSSSVQHLLRKFRGLSGSNLASLQLLREMILDVLTNKVVAKLSSHRPFNTNIRSRRRLAADSLTHGAAEDAPIAQLHVCGRPEFG